MLRLFIIEIALPLLSGERLIATGRRDCHFSLVQKVI